MIILSVSEVAEKSDGNTIISQRSKLRENIGYRQKNINQTNLFCEQDFWHEYHYIDKTQQNPKVCIDRTFNRLSDNNPHPFILCNKYTRN